jgi:uncharacterized protein
MSDPNAHQSAEPSPERNAPPQVPHSNTSAPHIRHDRQAAAWAHFGGVLSILALWNGWLALVAIIPAFVIFLAHGRRSDITRRQAGEALNFQITVVGAIIIWTIVSTLVTSVLWLTAGFGVLILVTSIFAIVAWALVFIDVIFSIVGGVKASGGGNYQYPFSLRFAR